MSKLDEYSHLNYMHDAFIAKQASWTCQYKTALLVSKQFRSGMQLKLLHEFLRSKTFVQSIMRYLMTTMTLEHKRKFNSSILFTNKLSNWVHFNHLRVWGPNFKVLRGAILKCRIEQKPHSLQHSILDIKCSHNYVTYSLFDKKRNVLLPPFIHFTAFSSPIYGGFCSFYSTILYTVCLLYQSLMMYFGGSGFAIQRFPIWFPKKSSPQLWTHSNETCHSSASCSYCFFFFFAICNRFCRKCPTEE